MGVYGIFLITGNAGFLSSSVVRFLGATSFGYSVLLHTLFQLFRLRYYVGRNLDTSESSLYLNCYGSLYFYTWG